MAIITIEPRITVRMGISRSVRNAAAELPPPCVRASFNPERSAETIVGMVRSSVMSPAAATAPAPIGRMYVPQI